MSRQSITERVARRSVDTCKTLVETQGTLRSCAQLLQLPKSTIYYDIERCKYVNYNWYCKARAVIDKNMCERAYRGGKAMQKKLRLEKELW